ncbi:hypothetical protein [Streptomyces sp. NBC_00268]|uniref:hypothetical protein n=1 Tax=Streptomyces sp. NBC_00268 TaxID=2975695 RepID=UPI0022513777|nr:hypothetical protein [Streptomyces sp. NBC_00268]MCX5181532.1 hypothetical protein [Streptomyces sp. NBC_00268]
MYIGTDVTNDVFESPATRAARRLSTLPVPNRPRGVVSVYDVTDDWTPIYGETDLPVFCVAIGTSGNQFKKAPLVGGFLRTIIDQTESGVDHDRHPAVFKLRHSPGVTVPPCGDRVCLTNHQKFDEAIAFSPSAPLAATA